MTRKSLVTHTAVLCFLMASSALSPGRLNADPAAQDPGTIITTSLRFPLDVKADGKDLWVASTSNGGAVYRVRASDGKLLETWTGAGGAAFITLAPGRVIVAANSCPGKLYMIDPSQPAGVISTVSRSLGCAPQAVTFDGARVWTVNNKTISIITPTDGLSWPVTTIAPGLRNGQGILFDGSNIWVTDREAGKLLKLDSTGLLIQTVPVGENPIGMVFDGTNIWVLNTQSNDISIVRAATGVVETTLSGNGLAWPLGAAFDGQRVLVTNVQGGTVSLWKATDLTPLGSFNKGTDPFRACSDGANFWVTMRDGNLLVRIENANLR